MRGREGRGRGGGGRAVRHRGEGNRELTGREGEGGERRREGG